MNGGGIELSRVCTDILMSTTSRMLQQQQQQEHFALSKQDLLEFDYKREVKRGVRVVVVAQDSGNR